LVKVASDETKTPITKPTVKNIVQAGTKEELEVKNLPDKPELVPHSSQKLSGAELLAQIKSKNSTPVPNNLEEAIG